MILKVFLSFFQIQDSGVKRYKFSYVVPKVNLKVIFFPTSSCKFVYGAEGTVFLYVASTDTLKFVFLFYFLIQYRDKGSVFYVVSRRILKVFLLSYFIIQYLDKGSEFFYVVSRRNLKVVLLSYFLIQYRNKGPVFFYVVSRGF